MTPRKGDAPPLEVLKDSIAPRLPNVVYDPPPPSEDQATISLREYLDVIAEGRRIVAAVLGLAVALGAAYAFLAVPVYRTDALVQVESKKTGTGFLADLAGPFEQISPAETEMEVLRSRAIVAAVVRELRLDIVAEPRRFPVVGDVAARRHRRGGVAGPFLGKSWGWGGEQVTVDRLEVPEDLLGKPFVLLAGDGNRYVLLDPGGAPLVEGEVGKPAAGRGVSLFVSGMRARPGLEFTVTRLRQDEVVASLQDEIRIAEKGKKTGILQLSLEGGSPGEIAAIIDALSRAYVRQNVERKSAEAEKTLAFLETQLPVLRASLDAAEKELETYRARHGSVDVTLATQGSLTRFADIEKALAELRVEQSALRERFTEVHPAFVAAQNKIRQLESEREAIEGRLRKLPEAELESARRMRDVKVANELYVTVLNKAQELKVVKEGTIGNVRILDAAVVPVKPIAPQKVRVLAIALFLGLLGGVAAAILRRSLAEGIEDPDALERATGIAVTASVPHSVAQADAERRSTEGAAMPLLAYAAPTDLTVESLRSLRTSIQFALVEAPNGIVAVGGPAPGVGKSFVVANIAHLLGEAGKQVVVLDADLRRGRLHHAFGQERGRGLSDAIAGEVPVGEVLRDTRSPNVRLLTTGTLPPNPAELLGSERCQRLLQELASRFDVVVVDTPPVLAVTDGALVGRHAGVNLLVIRSGKHPMREIFHALRQFARNGVRVHGIVMNDVRLDRGLGRRNLYHYQYRYG
ncbi:MAG TPA: polysaccharide biosynthesis tyrosine autokinase [Anaeromyxobacter sp.]